MHHYEAMGKYATSGLFLSNYKGREILRQGYNSMQLNLFIIIF